MNTVYSKYLAAFIQLGIFVLGAVQVVLPGGIAPDESWQLAALIAGAVATFFLPLVNGPWSGVLKTGAALIAALATAVIPFVVPGAEFDGAAALVVGLAVLNALATQIGVAVRLDNVKAALSGLGSGINGTVGVPAIPDSAAALIVTGKHSASV